MESANLKQYMLGQPFDKNKILMSPDGDLDQISRKTLEMQFISPCREAQASAKADT